MTSSLTAQLASSLKPTPEQQAIIEAIARPESQLVQAYAGTAKTTTLVMAAQAVRRPALALAFNKKIAEELQVKLPRSFTVKTLNALGYQAWRMANPSKNFSVAQDKRRDIIAEVCKEHDLRDRDSWAGVRDLVQALQAIGAAPRGMGEPLVELDRAAWRGLARKCWIDWESIDRVGEAAMEALRRCILSAQAGQLTSFDDQIYMPLVFGGKWPKFGLVLGDEVQDWNQLNHEMVKRCLGQGGKLVLAGDSRQSLYAFRGALSDSMEKAKLLAPEWLEQKLTLTFRCPQAVVERQQDHAPGYEAAPSNKKGQVLEWGSCCRVDEMLLDWQWKELADLTLGRSCAVLCRNNAPLLSLCLKLLRRGIRTAFLGKDLGKGLLALAKRVCGKAQTQSELILRIEKWQEKESQGLEDQALEAVLDRADCLRALAEGASSGQSLVASLERVLAQDGPVALASIHRAKGLEWDVVMHLDPWRVPRKGARGEELVQDLNCKYVAETRTRDVLVLANLGDLVWEDEQ